MLRCPFGRRPPGGPRLRHLRGPGQETPPGGPRLRPGGGAGHNGAVEPVALFDLDNTLVDQQGAFRRWAVEFASTHGLGDQGIRWLCAADQDGFARRDQLFAAARERFGLDVTVEALVAAFRARYPDFFTPDPAVQGALAELANAGWKIAIVTNGPSTQWQKVRRSGLEPLVDACCISEEIGSAKPDARIFAEAVLRCRRTPGSPGRPTAARAGSVQDGGPTDPSGWAPSVWMVGDTPAPDIWGARQMGYQTVWMHRGRPWPAASYTPHAIAGSVPEAVDILLGRIPARPPSDPTRSASGTAPGTGGPEIRAEHASRPL